MNEAKKAYRLVICQCQFNASYSKLCTYPNCCPNVLGEDDALELDHKEVDKLLEVIEEALKGFLGDDKVFAGTHTGCQAVSEEGMTQDFRCSCDYEVVSH
jgi:hypothetical protein